MPLSPPKSPRKRLHTRCIECLGYRRDDGLWDIEAVMTDAKTYDFPNHDRGGIKAGEPLHDMSLRVTVNEELLILDAEAVIDHGPFRICHDIAPAYKTLIGLRIARGFHRRARALFNGPAGCSHLRELLRPLAAAAFQTVGPARAEQRRERDAETPPALLDSCYALRSGGEAAAREWPRFYTGPSARGEAS